MIGEINPNEYPLLSDGSWLPVGELVSAASAIALLASMFVVRWYGVVGPPRGPEGSGISSAENAWDGLTVLRWLMLLTIFVALGSFVVHAVRRSRAGRMEIAGVLVALSGLTSALLIFRVLIDPPSPRTVVDIKLGGFLGLLSSIGIVIGALNAVRGERALRAARYAGAGRKLSPAATPR